MGAAMSPRSSSQSLLCAAWAPGRLATYWWVVLVKKLQARSELVELRAIAGGLWPLSVDPAVPLQAPECGL